MFGMLSVLAELQRELVVANTMDGLTSARARGRVGGRRPKLTADQVTLAPGPVRHAGQDRPADRGLVRSAALDGVRAPEERRRTPPAEEAPGEGVGGTRGQPVDPLGVGLGRGPRPNCWEDAEIGM